MDLFTAATIVLSAAIILYAYLRKKIEFTGFAASGFVGLAALLSVGPEWLYLILAFFILGNLVTRYKYKVKEDEGLAEKSRSFKNVFGNGGAAIVYALLYRLVDNNPLFLLGFLGSMAAATADTFATEVGEAHDKQPIMVTTWKKVKRGTSGAISPTGCMAALIGAAAVSIVPSFFTIMLNKPLLFGIGTLAGCIGCTVDSFVGATIEGKSKFLDNHSTNFIGTLAGGLAAIIIYAFLV